MCDDLPEITDSSRVFLNEIPGGGPSKPDTKTYETMSVMHNTGSVTFVASLDFDHGCPPDAWTRSPESITLRPDLDDLDSQAVLSR